MDQDQLRTFCILPRWRIRVDEGGDAVSWYRIYWEWCDARGNSSTGHDVAGGHWRLFRDSQGELRFDWSAYEDDHARQILRNWAKFSGYVDDRTIDITSQSHRA